MRRFHKVVVLMGGPSAEREVSLRSGTAVAKGLRDAGYDVAEVDVAGYELDLPDDAEAVFVALHGEFGEDGRIQRLLEEKGIPYTGSGPAASRTAFDKVLSKKVFVENGIPTPKYEVLRNGDASSLPLPVVTKPACQGSSIGVNRALRKADLADAIADAFRYGSEVIVEEYIDGRELTVGIVEDEALPIIEIVAPDKWYDYDAKYTRGKSDYLVPAPIDDKLGAECRSLAMRTFEALGCRGFARVDFRLSTDGRIYVLELNSIPGFTETSLLPKAAARAGMSFSGLCDRILNSA